MISGLIKKFQERLDVSRKSAIYRVIAFILLSICFISTVVALILFFPSRPSFKEKIALLPLSNYTQIIEMRGGDGVVLANRDKFIEVAKGNQVCISLYGDAILYKTKVAELSYYYKQIIAPVDRWYFIQSMQIQDGFVYRENKRAIVRFISFQVVILSVLFLAISRAQTRCVSGWLWNKGVYKEVWFDN